MGCLAALLLPAVSAARGAAQRMECINNAKQITLSMHNYANAYGTFPPAYVADENGKPMHSWRILIMEFSDPATFAQYDMSKPWDSPENLALLDRVPNVYGCPLSNQPGETNYMVVTGPGTLYPKGDSAPMIRDITDGTSNTVLLVEVHNTGVNWTEPADLPIEQVSTPINSSQPSSPHPKGAVVGYADGSVRFLKEGTDDQNLIGEIHPSDRK
ncbi:MAG: prepilin-type processing-associated H-X9-DG protein [Pirellulaceae bacterium]|jgi:prepilin-type processing-associated H-X9-DG protein